MSGIFLRVEVSGIFLRVELSGIFLRVELSGIFLRVEVHVNVWNALMEFTILSIPFRY